MHFPPPCRSILIVASSPIPSGQRTSVLAGVPVLKELFEKSSTSGGPYILPGAGINPGSIRAVMDNLLGDGLSEVHLSGGRWTESEMVYRAEGMGMGASVQNEWGIWRTDGNSIREVRSIADAYLNAKYGMR